jgi:hypothetical protein
METASILIVEDEGLIALDLRKKLEQVGYIVPAIADNATDALNAVERYDPSLVLMDIRIRGPQDGIETAGMIRQRFQTPVMFVTAHADRDTLERARITEPFGYIVKPFHSVDFRAMIEMALWKHKMEQKLRVSEAWLSTTFRNVADALIATDKEGNVAFMNRPASKLTGWDWREARGKPLLDIFQVFEEATDLPVFHPLDAIYDGRELGTAPKTYKLRGKGSEDFVLVESEMSANRDEGNLLGIIVVFRDVTARRRAERQQQQLQKMNSLALMAIGLGRELADSQRRMDDCLKQLIAQSHGSTLRMLGDVYQLSSYQHSVVQQLVALGRTETGESVTLDVNQVLSEMEGKFRKSLGVRRTLHLNLQPEIPAIRADSTALRENVMRLVIDARQAMPDGGVVEISTRALELDGNPERVEITIRDTGKGIRASARERIFEPYYQSRPGSGNPGFSLALVYQFVALSGGTIEVETEPGQGVAYHLRFPAVANPPHRHDIGTQRMAVSA